MEHKCPATRFFQDIHARFKSRMEAMEHKHARSCAKISCPITRFKGRVAGSVFKKMEKDTDFQDQMNRGMVKDLSIMFADIRGFTNRTAEMPPDRIVTLLDLFVPEMLNIIINRRRGMVDKLLGDGIMALFGHPYETDQDVIQAIFAAIDMQQAAAALDKVLEISGYDPIQIGVGINTGPVLICEVGDQNYRESTVIGAPVNLAAKMEDVAEAGAIVLPQDALEKVDQARPEMIEFFEYLGSRHGVDAVSLDWAGYIAKGGHQNQDWDVGS